MTASIGETVATRGEPAPAGFIEDLFETARMSGWMIGIIVLSVCVTVAEGCDVAAVSTGAPLLIKHFGISAGLMGALLASGVLGTVASSYVLAPIADRLGRRPAVLAGVSLACVASAVGAFAPSIGFLVICRILAGAGIGLTTPAIFAVVAETLPARMRTMGTMIAGCGFVLGGGTNTLLSSLLIDTYGHRAPFFVASAIELVVIALCFFILPESPFFQVRKGRAGPVLQLWLNRLGVAPAHPPVAYALRNGQGVKSRVGALFTPERRSATLMLWIANFCTLSLIYLNTNWLPTLLVRAGETMGPALCFVSLASFVGAIISVLIAWSTTRIRPAFILAGGYVALAAIGLTLSATGLSPQFHILLAAQIVVNASLQFCLMGVINRFYSAEVRATGVGYALGAGRIGALSAPLAGGFLVAQDLTIQNILGLTAIPAGVACAALMYLIAKRKLRENLVVAPAH